MNLPVVLDVALGLIFIYLIASLLAAEIQELISTLLQWRAKHLKDAIANLLSGEQGIAETDKLSTFVETLYEDPLLKNMNQGATGSIGKLGRWLYHNIFYRKSIFGKRSTGPSYIAPETFATALLQQLGMAVLIDKLTEVRLEKFVTRIIGLHPLETGSLTIPPDDYFNDRDTWEKGGIRVIAHKARVLDADAGLLSDNSTFNLSQDENFYTLAEDYDDIIRDFKSQEATLPICVDRLREGLETYIRQIDDKLLVDAEAAAFNTSTETQFGSLPTLSNIERRRLSYYKKRLESFKLNTFGAESERAVLSGKLKPSLPEIAQIFDRSSSIYQEIAAAYREVAAVYNASRSPEALQLLLQQIATRVRKISVTEREPLSSSKPISSSQDLADLLKDEQTQPYLEQVLSQLDEQTQEDFKGWQTYDRIIVNVMFKIAQILQQQKRLSINNQQVKASLSSLDSQIFVTAAVESLDRLFNEERHLVIDQALSEFTPEDREVFRNYETYRELQQLLQKVPDSVKQSLAILANRAQTKVQQTDEQLDQFTQEVAVWFDRSMSRASGVYKRNAKGVALLLGLLIAVLSNTDTFHIVSRLANDEDLRQIITQRAGDVRQRVSGDETPTTQEDLRELKFQTDSVLREIAFPMQWTPANLREQFSCPISSKDTDLNDWAAFYKDCLPNQATSSQRFDPLVLGKIASSRLFDLGRILAGWLLSGVAIAMGAPFWFDLMSKVMNVRNTGAKPAPVEKGSRGKARDEG